MSQDNQTFFEPQSQESESTTFEFLPTLQYESPGLVNTFISGSGPFELLNGQTAAVRDSAKANGDFQVRPLSLTSMQGRHHGICEDSTGHPMELLSAVNCVRTIHDPVSDSAKVCMGHATIQFYPNGHPELPRPPIPSVKYAYAALHLPRNEDEGTRPSDSSPPSREASLPPYSPRRSPDLPQSEPSPPVTTTHDPGDEPSRDPSQSTGTTIPEGPPQPMTISEFVQHATAINVQGIVSMEVHPCLSLMIISLSGQQAVERQAHPETYNHFMHTSGHFQNDLLRLVQNHIRELEEEIQNSDFRPPDVNEGSRPEPLLEVPVLPSRVNNLCSEDANDVHQPRTYYHLLNNTERSHTPSDQSMTSSAMGVSPRESMSITTLSSGISSISIASLSPPSSPITFAPADGSPRELRPLGMRQAPYAFPNATVPSRAETIMTTDRGSPINRTFLAFLARCQRMEQYM